MGNLENGTSLIKKINAWFYHRRRQDEMLQEMLNYHQKAEARAVERAKEDAERKIAEINKEKRDIQQQNQIDEILKEITKVNEDLQLLKSGTQNSLVYSLRNEYNRLKKIGYATPADKIRYEKAYKAYHALGINGVEDRHYEKIMNMPESSEED